APGPRKGIVPSDVGLATQLEFFTLFSGPPGGDGPSRKEVSCPHCPRYRRGPVSSSSERRRRRSFACSAPGILKRSHAFARATQRCGRRLTRFGSPPPSAASA